MASLEEVVAAAQAQGIAVGSHNISQLAADYNAGTGFAAPQGEDPELEAAVKEKEPTSTLTSAPSSTNPYDDSYYEQSGAALSAAAAAAPAPSPDAAAENPYDDSYYDQSGAAIADAWDNAPAPDPTPPPAPYYPPPPSPITGGWGPDGTWPTPYGPEGTPTPDGAPEYAPVTPLDPPAPSSDDDTKPVASENPYDDSFYDQSGAAIADAWDRSPTLDKTPTLSGADAIKAASDSFFGAEPTTGGIYVNAYTGEVRKMSPEQYAMAGDEWKQTSLHALGMDYTQTGSGVFDSVVTAVIRDAFEHGDNGAISRLVANVGEDRAITILQTIKDEAATRGGMYVEDPAGAVQEAAEWIAFETAMEPYYDPETDQYKVLAAIKGGVSDKYTQKFFMNDEGEVDTAAFTSAQDEAKYPSYYITGADGKELLITTEAIKVGMAPTLEQLSALPEFETHSDIAHFLKTASDTEKGAIRFFYGADVVNSANAINVVNAYGGDPFQAYANGVPIDTIKQAGYQFGKEESDWVDNLGSAYKVILKRDGVDRYNEIVEIVNSKLPDQKEFERDNIQSPDGKWYSRADLEDSGFTIQNIDGDFLVDWNKVEAAEAKVRVNALIDAGLSWDSISSQLQATGTPAEQNEVWRLNELKGHEVYEEFVGPPTPGATDKVLVGYDIYSIASKRIDEGGTKDDAIAYLQKLGFDNRQSIKAVHDQEWLKQYEVQHEVAIAPEGISVNGQSEFPTATESSWLPDEWAREMKPAGYDIEKIFEDSLKQGLQPEDTRNRLVSMGFDPAAMDEIMGETTYFDIMPEKEAVIKYLQETGELPPGYKLDSRDLSTGAQIAHNYRTLYLGEDVLNEYGMESARKVHRERESGVVVTERRDPDLPSSEALNAELKYLVGAIGNIMQPYNLGAMEDREMAMLESYHANGQPLPSEYSYNVDDKKGGPFGNDFLGRRITLQDGTMVHTTEALPTAKEQNETAMNLILPAIPIYGTIRYWDDMSTGWKVGSVVMDAIVVGGLAKAGVQMAKAATPVGRAKNWLSGQKAYLKQVEQEMLKEGVPQQVAEGYRIMGNKQLQLMDDLVEYETRSQELSKLEAQLAKVQQEATTSGIPSPMQKPLIEDLEHSIKLKSGTLADEEMRLAKLGAELDADANQFIRTLDDLRSSGQYWQGVDDALVQDAKYAFTDLFNQTRHITKSIMKPKAKADIAALEKQLAKATDDLEALNKTVSLTKEEAARKTGLQSQIGDLKKQIQDLQGIDDILEKLIVKNEALKKNINLLEDASERGHSRLIGDDAHWKYDEVWELMDAYDELARVQEQMLRTMQDWLARDLQSGWNPYGKFGGGGRGGGGGKPMPGGGGGGSGGSPRPGGGGGGLAVADAISPNAMNQAGMGFAGAADAVASPIKMPKTPGGGPDPKNLGAISDSVAAPEAPPAWIPEPSTPDPIIPEPSPEWLPDSPILPGEEPEPERTPPDTPLEPTIKPAPDKPTVEPETVPPGPTVEPAQPQIIPGPAPDEPVEEPDQFPVGPPDYEPEPVPRPDEPDEFPVTPPDEEPTPGPPDESPAPYEPPKPDPVPEIPDVPPDQHPDETPTVVPTPVPAPTPKEPDTEPDRRTQPSTKPDTETETETETKEETGTSRGTGITTQGKTETETKTRTSTKATEQTAVTQTAVPTPKVDITAKVVPDPKVLPKPRLKPKPKIIPDPHTSTKIHGGLPMFPDEEKTGDKPKAKQPGVVSWKQGVVWVTVFPPTKDGDGPKVLYTREAPPMTKRLHGDPQETLHRRYGNVPQKMSFDMGFIDVGIEKHGKLLDFDQDPKIIRARGGSKKKGRRGKRKKRG